MPTELLQKSSLAVCLRGFSPREHEQASTLLTSRGHRVVRSLGAAQFVVAGPDANDSLLESTRARGLKIAPWDAIREEMDVASARASEAGARQAKWLFSACLKGVGRFTLPSYPMQKPRPFCPSSRSGWSRTASSTRTPSDPTMPWTSAISIIAALTTQSSSPIRQITSTASKTSGTRPSAT